MLKISRICVLLTVVLCILCSESRVFGTVDVYKRLVSPSLLRASGLELVWESKVPIQIEESLSKLFILGGRIYALSSRNYIVSMDRENGRPIFSRPLAAAGFPVEGFELYDNELISIIGNRLVQINPDSGEEVASLRLDFRVSCPAARNSSYFYMADVNRRLRVLRERDRVKIFEAAAENESWITSILANENFVIFSTDAGNVISIRADESKRLWQFDAGGGVIGPMVRDGEQLFFAGKDTSVYSISIEGALLWKYPAGGVLDRSPRVTREVVYQNVGENGLAAISKRNGKRIWELPEGVDLLAESGARAYVITKTGALTVMDNITRKRSGCIRFILRGFRSTLLMWRIPKFISVITADGLPA
ncbi:MAG: outer membrane protein assembly factor BamB family protein [Planctomycetota bacterium]|jgi:outer membrane protein assembly factor BamB